MQDRTHDYARIINNRHFDRLLALLEGCNIVYGGKYNREKLWIEPTLVDSVNFSDAIMAEEIFGPVLPILPFDNLEEVISLLKDKPKPLALYVFSRNKRTIRNFIEKLDSGTICINGTLSPNDILYSSIRRCR